MKTVLGKKCVVACLVLVLVLLINMSFSNESVRADEIDPSADSYVSIGLSDFTDGAYIEAEEKTDKAETMEDAMDNSYKNGFLDLELL